MEENKRDFKGIWIPKEIWLDTRLNATEKIILVEIDSLDSSERGCWASNKHLAEFCQCSERTVSNAISKLVEYGYIYIKSFDGRNREIKSKYTLQSNLEINSEQHRKNCEAEKKKLRESNTENNTENNTPNKKTTKGFDAVVEEYTTNADLKAAIFDFIKFRKAIKAPLTDRALTLCLNKLDKLANNDLEKIAVLNQSIERGWRGLFEVKDNSFNAPAPKSNTTIPTEDDYDFERGSFWK